MATKPQEVTQVQECPGTRAVRQRRAARLAVGQNPVPLVNIKIDGKWMFIHPNMQPYCGWTKTISHHCELA